MPPEPLNGQELRVFIREKEITCDYSRVWVKQALKVEAESEVLEENSHLNCHHLAK